MFAFALLSIPVACFVVAQGLKIINKSIEKPFSLKHLSAYGGMPSAHTATVVSLIVVSWLHDGTNSMTFVISVILAVLIIRDALGLRMHLSEHSRILNRIIRDVGDIDTKKFPHLGERLGHTWQEVLAGGVLAVVVSMTMYYLIFI